MTKEDIIAMARRAGAHDDGNEVRFVELRYLERFAALVAAAEREKVAAWMMQRSYATGHGDTTEDLLKQLEWQIAEREREACAKVCDELAARDKLSNYYAVAAKAIRARGNT
jgi:hypothetical protein